MRADGMNVSGIEGNKLFLPPTTRSFLRFHTVLYLRRSSSETTIDTIILYIFMLQYLIKRYVQRTYEFLCVYHSSGRLTDTRRGEIS
jgi:hypothetical protein